ncbi:MAG: glycerophosphodiester phosphodiesterase family protein [Pseudomonadales bacterium]
MRIPFSVVVDNLEGDITTTQTATTLPPITAFEEFVLIGHRGACGYEPENTLISFERAIAMGCLWTELDVYAVENELIVIHDDWLERTTNGTGRVMDASLAYLRSLDAGKGERIPLLSEVIDKVDHRAGINIELKGPDTAKPVTDLLDGYCSRGWHSDEFLLSSFDHNELAKADPRYRRGVLFSRRADYFAVADQLNAWSVNWSRKLVTPLLVETAHQRDLKVLVYTVNQPEEILAMQQMGVDGIFTDYPDRNPRTVS